MIDPGMPVVSVWRRGTTEWLMVGRWQTWETLTCELRHLEPGSWSIAGPLDAQAVKVTPGRVVTVDFRGQRVVTGLVTRHNPHSDDETGRPVLEVGGAGALALLSHVECWPVPANALSAQTSEYYTATGAAETVLRTLIIANAVTRHGYDIAIPADEARGSTITLNLRFDNLLETVATHARAAGLGVRVGLVDSSSSTRGEMTCEFFEPADLTNRARLSHKVGSLRSWSHNNEAPTLTRATVGGAGEGTARVYREVADTAAEAEWGFKISKSIDARDTFDTTTLDQRGQEALAEGAAQASFGLQVTDAEGMRYGTHYNLGDMVRVELLTGVAKDDIVTAVTLAAGEDGVTVTPVVGNPDSTDPTMQLAAILSGVARETHKLQTRR